jgi:8-oxo-dGTP pyrophosphatase MutT (NUDIX family)
MMWSLPGFRNKPSSGSIVKFCREMRLRVLVGGIALLVGQPTVMDGSSKRQFACSPACVLAFILYQNEQFLMLSNPRTGGRWEVVNGALEVNETILGGVLRGVAEEAGAQVSVRPLGVLHTFNYSYDDKVRYMINTSYLRV